MGKHVVSKEKTQLRCCAAQLEILAHRMMARGQPEGFTTRDRKLYLEYHHGVELKRMVEDLRAISQSTSLGAGISEGSD